MKTENNEARASAATQAVPEPVATILKVGPPQFDREQVLLEWEAGVRMLDRGTHKLYAAAPPVALPALTDGRALWNMNRPMLEELLALTVPGSDDDEPVEVSLCHLKNGPDGPGLYAYYTEYPEEGVTLIDGKSDVLRAEGRASVLAASAAPAPEQPNAGAGAEQDHLIAPLAGSVCGVNAADGVQEVPRG